jgi:hypothetical protein
MKRTNDCAENHCGCWFWFSMLALTLCSCSHEPAISKANVKLVGELKTAISAKRTDWLQAAARHVAEHRQHGQVSDKENSALELIIAAAQQDRWDDANADLTRLINAQRAP